MIKGKFYTGLTSEMMGRSRAVNRQETHFFWPDESDCESVAPRRTRTTARPSPAPANNNNTDTTQSDIKPKELFRKQLSSGIEFYDNVNAKTPEARRRRFKKIDNINLNNNDVDFQPEKKKLETFSSKIEFYDFEHENNAKNGKSFKSVNANDSRNKETIRDDIIAKNDSPDVNRKRISFQTGDKTVEKTKGILKNVDEKPQIEKVVVKPLPKRGLLPKNMSKSVENISRLAKNVDDSDVVEQKPEKLSTIIKEVKNLNLSQERSRNDYAADGRDERDSYRGPDRSEARRNNAERSYGHRNADRYESRGYQDDDYRHRHGDRDEPRRYDRYDYHEDRYDKGYTDRRYERTQRVSYSQPIDQARDTYETRTRSRHYGESPIRGRHSPAYDRYDREYESEPRRAPIRDSKPAPRYNDRYDEPPKRTIHCEEVNKYSSRKPNHIPQHLRTNILTNGHVMPQSLRPMSVRNSAVTRVGVGLPDIE